MMLFYSLMMYLSSVKVVSAVEIINFDDIAIYETTNGDYFEGDSINAENVYLIMDNNGTPDDVTDDIIIDVVAR